MRRWQDSDGSPRSPSPTCGSTTASAAAGNEILVTLLEALGPTLIKPREVNLVHDTARAEALAAHAGPGGGPGPRSGCGRGGDARAHGHVIASYTSLAGPTGSAAQSTRG